jgi:hypothetical protein
MRLSLGTIAVLSICFAGRTCSAQTVKTTSLCTLQENIAPGHHLHVRIAGIFTSGPESSTLDYPACQIAPYHDTWVDFDLRTERNDKKLKKLLEHSQRVYLEAEGEFYGPPLPDPKLPEALQQGSPPHWGHLGSCRTRLVVYAIIEVRALPKDQTGK